MLTQLGIALSYTEKRTHDAIRFYSRVAAINPEAKPFISSQLQDLKLNSNCSSVKKRLDPYDLAYPFTAT